MVDSALSKHILFQANDLNPLLRHLLEVTYECVVDSALSLEELQHTKTGLYLAIFGSDTDFIETSTCPKTNHGKFMKLLARTPAF